jgi:hypothetical protein
MTLYCSHIKTAFEENGEDAQIKKPKKGKR